MRNILFVCTGNTCRSPMAEAFCKQLIQEKGFKELSCSSAGLAAYPGSPASEFSIKVMGEVGIDLSGHRSQPLNAEMVAQADEIWASLLINRRLRLLCHSFREKFLCWEMGFRIPMDMGLKCIDPVEMRLRRQ